MSEKMEEINTIDTDSSEEAKLLNQLNSFDLNAPLKVDIIFEDSDDEQDISKIKTEKNISPNPKVNLDLTKRNLELTTVSNTTSPSVSNVIKETENRKRKPEDECSSITKIIKIENCDEINQAMKEVHLPSENDNTFNQIPSSFEKNSTISNNNEETNSNTNFHIAAYVCNLLKAVSRHLILIIDSNYKYRRTKLLNNQALTEKAYQHYLRVKCHFFNLSFCTVANVILPEIRNSNFIYRFLTDTFKLAVEKNVNHIVQSELRSLFAELVNWTRRKKAATDAIDANPPKPLKENQSQLPPMEINAKNTQINVKETDMVSNQLNHSMVTNISAIPVHIQNYISNSSCAEQLQQNLDKSLENYQNCNKNINASFVSFDYTFDATREQSKFEISRNKEHFPNVNVHYNQIATSQANAMSSQQTKPLDVNLSKSISFASGPPERRLSISLEPPLGPTCTVEESTNIKPNLVINQRKNPPQYQHQYPQQMQQYQQHQTPQMLQNSTSSYISYPNMQNSNSFTSYPGNNTDDQRQPRLIPQHQKQMFHQHLQQKVQHLQNYQQQILQQKTLSNMQSSGHSPSYLVNSTSNMVVDQRQPRTFLQNQQNFQQYKYYPKQMSQQTRETIVENSGCFASNPTNNVHSTNMHHMPVQMHPATWQFQKPAPQCEEIQKPPPPYPIETISFETAYNLLNEKEKHSNGVQAQMTQIHQALQSESSNAEITRSGSTDSGFMSPLNFNCNETSKERTEEDECSTPVITHITSLNPTATYIAESNCCICGKVTRKMCLGCYKKYYCSTACQRTDWTSHMAICKQKTTM